MSHILLKRVINNLKYGHGQAVAVKNLQHLLYIFRYHDVLSKPYTKSVLDLICQKLEKIDSKSTEYENYLAYFCRLSSLRKLTDMNIYRFKEFFLKTENNLQWDSLKSIAIFLNYIKNYDSECMAHFNKLLMESLKIIEKKEKRPKYLIKVFQFYNNGKELEEKQIRIFLEKFQFFKAKMKVSQILQFVLTFKNTERLEFQKLYQKFIKDNKILEKIEVNIKEIPLLSLILLFKKLLNLGLNNISIYNSIIVEIIERKNYISEREISLISQILNLPNFPHEHKKNIATVFKQVLIEKNSKNALKITDFHRQTYFYLTLKNLNLMTSEEIEKFFFANFLLNPDPEVFKSTVINMINLSNNDYRKINKFIMWSFYQVLARIEFIPFAKVYQILENVKSFSDFNKDFLASLNAYISKMLEKGADFRKYVEFYKKENESNKNNISEYFSLNMVFLFLKKELFNQTDKDKINVIFSWFISELKKNYYPELLLEIPFNSFYVSLLNKENKEQLMEYLISDFEFFYLNEKIKLIDLLYSLTPESDIFFVNELTQIIENLQRSDFCIFFHIFLANPEKFQINQITEKILGTTLNLNDIYNLLKNADKIKLPDRILTHIEKSVLDYSCKNGGMFYSLPTLMEIFNNNSLFKKEFFEKLKKKIMSGDFKFTEHGINQVLKVLNK